MSVARMLKVTVIGYRPLMDDVIAALQRAGMLEVKEHPFELPAEDVSPDDARLHVLDEQTADARFVEEFLSRYHVNKRPFSTFVSEKFHVDANAFFQLGFDARMKRLYQETLRLSDRLAAGERERARLTDLCDELLPWVDFHTQVREWRHTERTVLFTGTVPAGEGSEIRQALREQVTEVTVEELGPVSGRQAWVVMAMAGHADEVREVLAAHGFAPVLFADLKDYPAEELERAKTRLVQIDEETAHLGKQAEGLAAEYYDHTVALVQAVESERDRLLVRRGFARTEQSFAISGWVRKDNVAGLHEALGAFRHIDMSFAEPTDDDSPPVELDNPRWLRPLEVLTDLYGRPQYRELDPTPLLAPFFLLFFGICISDVGYGAMIIVGSYLIMTRIDVAEGVKRFLKLLMYGGVVAMGVGVAFASYFALPVEMLPSALADLQVLNPLEDLTTFLLFSLGLGVVQVFFGVFIAAFDAFRRGDPAEAVYGHLSVVFLFVCIVLLVVTGQGIYLSVGLVGTMLMQGRAIEASLGNAYDPAWQRGVGVVWLLGALASAVFMGVWSVLNGLLILLASSVLCMLVSRPARKAVLGLLGGAYAVYGMTSFVGDILSYLRLAALGLSGVLVGYVFNLLAGLVWEPAAALFAQGGLSIILGAVVAALAALVFVGGHTFNVVINLLGAFVHPARLQFVEFFSKFYEGGGQPFAPLRFRTDSLVLETGDAGSKGGTSS